MADKSTQPAWDPLVLAGQLQSIATQSQALMQRFVSTQTDATKFGMGDTSTLGFDFADLMTKMMTDPTAVAKAQIDLFNESLAVWQRATERMFMLPVSKSDSPKDKRFKHPEWTENVIFSFIKDSYLVAAKSVLSAVRDVKGMDEATARKIDFYTRQFVDALSPSNFVTTNPEVLTATLHSGGQNLLRGLENLLADLERGDGRLSITMTDMKAFHLGENIATTPGKSRLSERAHAIAPVYALDARSSQAAAPYRAAMDQQVLRAGFAAQEFLHQVGRRSGALGIRHFLGQSR